MAYIAAQVHKNHWRRCVSLSVLSVLLVRNNFVFTSLILRLTRCDVFPRTVNLSYKSCRRCDKLRPPLDRFVHVFNLSWSDWLVSWATVVRVYRLLCVFLCVRPSRDWLLPYVWGYRSSQQKCSASYRFCSCQEAQNRWYQIEQIKFCQEAWRRQEERENFQKTF